MEKPVVHISVRSTSRAPSSAARATRGARRSKLASRSSQTMSCWTAATFTGNTSSTQSLQARRCFVDHLEALAEREAHHGHPSLLVVIEHDVRNRDHATSLGQRAAEGEAVLLTQRTDVGRDEVGAV